MALDQRHERAPADREAHGVGQRELVHGVAHERVRARRRRSRPARRSAAPGPCPPSRRWGSSRRSRPGALAASAGRRRCRSRRTDPAAPRGSSAHAGGRAGAPPPARAGSGPERARAGRGAVGAQARLEPARLGAAVVVGERHQRRRGGPPAQVAGGRRPARGLLAQRAVHARVAQHGRGPSWEPSSTITTSKRSRGSVWRSSASSRASTLAWPVARGHDDADVGRC